MAELAKRYIVMAMATEAPFDLTDPEGIFVLKPWKDPAALRALEAYRDNCYPELGRELDVWIRTVKAGPVMRGGVGKQNEPFVKAPRPPVPTRPRPKAKAKVKTKAKARSKRRTAPKKKAKAAKRRRR